MKSAFTALAALASSLTFAAADSGLKHPPETALPESGAAIPREIRDISGWQVHIQQKLLETEGAATNHALELLKEMLDEIVRVVPANAVAELRKAPLYFSPAYKPGRSGAEFHPAAGWLRDHGRDPAMVGAVEFSGVAGFEAEMNRMPNFTLHELAHAYHHRVLKDGFDNLEIKSAYERAKASGKYERVERHYGNGKPNTHERAYAMTNPMEYFAESTEAFFVRNDFFPFTRDELKEHDPEMLALLEKLWGARPGKKPASFVPAAETKRPNVLFILTDDQGWGDAHFAGHPYVKTPNLDRMASQSTWFKQFYVAATVCSPSRCAFMTSHAPARHEIHGHFAEHAQNAARHMPDWLDPKTVTITKLLRDAGYATGHFGKWHLGGGPGAPTPGDYGIDVHCTVNSSGPSLGDEAKERFFRARSSSLIVDETIKFIRANKDRPFYANVWTLVPHAPLKPTPEQLQAYEELSPRADDPAFGEWMQKYAAAAKDLKTQMQVFCASLTDLDTQIGRLLQALDELGLADKTLILFSSDNGPEDYRIGNAANAGLGSTGPLRARKRSMYEGGIRTFGLVRWPGHVPAGRVDETSVISGLDWLPTPGVPIRSQP